MSWSQKTVVSILLLVARIICDDPTIQSDIKNLSNKISTVGS